MKPIRRIKKVDGREYWYEETPYYDPVSKQTRYKNSKYLGRNIDGKPVRVRDAPKEVQAQIRKNARTPAIRSTYDHGSVMLLTRVVQDLQLDQHLRTILSASDATMVTALAFNRILRPMAMKDVGTWYAGTSLALDSPPIILTGQRISELLDRIGTSTVPQQLMQRLLDENETKRTLIYDITSLSSHSALMNLLEYGCNRDGVTLPQINLSLIMDKDLGIPVMYDLYPGSITDVTTLTGTLQKLAAYGVNDYIAIMDRGFFSQHNLQEMVAQEISFIIAATFKLKEVKLLLTEAQRDITNVEYLQKFKKKTLYAKSVVLTLGSNQLSGYLFYDPKRELEEKESFTGRLIDIRDALANVRLKKGQQPAAMRVAEIAGNLKKFFEWRQVEDRIEATIRQNAVAQRMNRMGKFMVFYSGDVDWLTALSLYRERDEIEKEMEMMKSDLDILPLHTHKDSTTSGFVFVVFLALLIRARLLRMMTEAGLLKNHSVSSLLLELEKFRKITLADGQVVTTEMTKKQRLILEALKIM